MRKARVGAGLMAGWLLLWGGTSVALAQPSVAQTLSYRPKQEGVVYTTPTPQEQAACKVEPVRTSRGIIGWLLVDGKKQPLRRFADTNGDKRIDSWAYYKDGVEVYREIDSNGNDRADQFRWLNTGGMKWGVDMNEDGKIDTWKMISADEVAQEVYLAALTSDFNRLRALFITEQEVQAMRLPTELSGRIRNQLAQAQKKFEKLTKDMPPVADRTQIGQVTSAAPQCTPADAAGTEQDLFRYSARSILFEKSDKQPEWIQTGEMIQVGLAWRLIDGPVLGMDIIEHPSDSPELQKLKEQLAELDKAGIVLPPADGPNPKIVQYNLQRVEIIEKIVRLVKDNERETWVKQLADNLSTAALASVDDDRTALQKLTGYRDQIEKSTPGSDLAGYIVFRILWAEYSGKIGRQSTDLGKYQRAWLEELTKFVQTYPKAEDAADALNYLAMGCEFVGKDEEAKRWYKQLYTSFPDKPMAGKARGAEKRLDLVGNPMELAGKTLTGSQFDLSSVKGKVVVVYYWASYCKDCGKDLEELKKLHGSYNGKGFEVVTVNLDDRTEDGLKVLQNTSIPGSHLYQPGEATGLGGPLGMQYGIMTLPTTFLIGKDGKVINRNIQVNDLDTAVQKAL